MAVRLFLITHQSRVKNCSVKLSVGIELWKNGMCSVYFSLSAVEKLCLFWLILMLNPLIMLLLHGGSTESADLPVTHCTQTHATHVIINA